MDGTVKACVDIVGWRDTMEVVHIGLEGVEEEYGILARDGGNFDAGRANLQDQIVISFDLLVGGGVVDGCHVRGLEGGERVEEAIADLVASVDFSGDLKRVDFGGGGARLG